MSMCFLVVVFFSPGQVRGYKVFMQLLPHEVADVHPVLDQLSSQDPTDIEVRLAMTFLIRLKLLVKTESIFFLHPHL